MRFAALGDKVVAAADARHRQGYLCPNCGGEVFLRSGKTREAHFAHYPGCATAECDEYYPSSSIEGSSDVAPLEVEEAADTLGLTVVEGEDTWALYLRLPELDADALGHAPLTSLLPAHVEVLAGRSRVARVGAIELRPGIGACRVAIPPSAELYRCAPTGPWPPSVESSRWAATAVGISPSGSLFRLKAGEWVRLRPRSSVTWGEELRLVAGLSHPPPEAARPDASSAGVHHGEWCLWRVVVPSSPEDDVHRWLLGLGHSVAPLVWEVTVVSIPGALAEGLHSTRDPVLVRLVPPPDAAEGTLSVRHGDQTAMATLDLSHRAPRFAAIHADAPGEVEVLMEEDSGPAVCFEFVRTVDDDGLKSVMRRIPRLRVIVSGDAHESWGEPMVHFQPRAGDVRVETSVEGARLDVVAWTGPSRRVWRGLTRRVAEKTISDILPEAGRIEVDAGNLGRVVLSRRPRVEARKLLPADRLHRWLRAADCARGRASRVLAGLAVASARDDRVLDERLRPLARALSRRRRRGSR